MLIDDAAFAGEPHYPDATGTAGEGGHGGETNRAPSVPFPALARLLHGTSAEAHPRHGCCALLTAVAAGPSLRRSTPVARPCP